MRKVLLLLFLALILLPPISAQFFVDDEIRLFPFVADGKWGFIDKAGNIVIKPEFKSASPFDSGYAVVELQDGKMTLVSSKGKFAFEPVDFRLLQPSEGLARALKDGKWGYVNVKGDVAIPFRYEEAGNFFNGVARVRIERKFAFIDARGKFLTRLYKKAFNFSEGLAIVEIDGKRGFIDLFDEIAIEPAYDDSDGFSQGLAAVRLRGKYGYIDRSGTLVIKAQFDNARWFSDGYAPVEIDGKWGFIDRDGKFRIKPAYSGVGNFYDGMASILVDEKWGYIDKKGRIVIPPRFTRAGNFVKGLASVASCSQSTDGNKREICNLAYVTKNGEIVWNSKF